MATDGPEQREADRAESFERGMRDCDKREQLADESYEGGDQVTVDALTPVRCIVRGHNYSPFSRACYECGSHQDFDPIARRRLDRFEIDAIIEGAV